MTSLAASFFCCLNSSAVGAIFSLSMTIMDFRIDSLEGGEVVVYRDVDQQGNPSEGRSESKKWRPLPLQA